MKISTRGRYGLRALLQLAVNYTDKPVLLNDMARSQDLSPKYLHALLTTLKKAEIIRSIRGVYGGYLLARPPEEIRLSDVVKALEGNLQLADCIESNAKCNRSLDCITRGIWSELSEVMENFLNGITLADLVKRHEDHDKQSRHH